jgi:hypothetical protein
VSPRAPYGVDITSVVVRSVIQYKLDDSGYVVDIAIYRSWDGSNTLVEPAMATSVSMFHQAWDWEMESIENTTKERGWNKTLSHFFDNGLTQEGCGLQSLLAEIEVIQGFLSSAKKSTKSKKKSSA